MAKGSTSADEMLEDSKTSTDCTMDSSKDVENGNDSGDETVPEMPSPGAITVVTSLKDYEGDNLYQKLDSFVATHPVALINRSWCIFSIDTVDFLSRMGFDIHSFEIDQHPHEKNLVKYLKQKYSHATSPWIFIAGDFLGGFEDVNVLYNQGTLQKDHLSKLAQADQCEKVAAMSTTKPLFWFPVTVNAHAVRSTGVLTCLMAAASAVLSFFSPWGQYIAYYLLLDFVLRIAGGARIAPVGIIATFPTKFIDPKPRSGRPKQFASCCGFLFAMLASVFYLAPFPYHEYVGSLFMIILSICCGMEGFFDFCLGCVFFKIGLQLKLIPR